MIRVLIADDHHVVRRGLMVFLKTQKDIEVIGEAKNGLEAVALAEELQPDIILMDLVMPELDGIGATKRITEKFPTMPVLMLTSFSDRDHVVPAMKAGNRMVAPIMKRHAPISIVMDLVTSPSPVFIFIYICSAPMMATMADMA